MKEGEPVLGGPQANPGVAGMSNSGTQPIVSGAQAAASRQNRYITQPPSHFTPRQPISPDGDDIIISNHDVKKPKKGLIIILAILFTLIIVGAVAGLVFSQQNSAQGQLNDTLINDFYIYANNLLFGEENSNPITDFEAEDFFYIDENYSDAEYLKSLLADYDKFFTQAKSNNKNGLEESSLLESKVELEFLIQNNEIGFIEDSEVINKYYLEGEEAARLLVEEYYATNDTDTENIKTIKNYKKQVALDKIDILDAEGSPDEYKDIMDEIYNKVNESVYNLKKSCKSINSIIEGGSNEENK